MTELRCNCTDNGTVAGDPAAYCGDPACDIYYCEECEGEAPDVPCPRHEGMTVL